MVYLLCHNTISLSFLLKIFILFMCKAQLKRDTEKHIHRGILHLLIYSPNGLNSFGQVRLGAEKPIWVSNMGGRGLRTWASLCYPPSHINMELNQKQGSGGGVLTPYYHG